MILAILDLCHIDVSYQVSSQLAFLFRRKSEKKIFNMAASGHLLFLTRTILAFFDLQVTLMIPNNGPFSSGEEGKSRFSRCHLGYLNGKILAIFDL